MEQQHMPVPALPEELLTVIFSYLSLEDIMVRVRPVCQQWRDVADRDLLGKSLILGPSVPTKVVLRLLRAAANLQSLELNKKNDLHLILGAIYGLCKSLQRLTLRKCSPSISGEMLAEVLRGCPRLHSLTIDTDVSLRKGLCKELGTALPGLRGLELIGSYDKYDLNALLDNCPRLDKLRFGWSRLGNGLQDEDMSRLAQRWGDTLRTVDLNVEYITDAGLKALAGCSQLQELCLNIPCRLTLQGLHCLDTLKHLETLTLFDVHKLAENTLTNFFQDCACACQLQALTINRSPELAPSVLENIAARCCRLRRLTLSNCDKVTGHSLGSVLQGCRELRRLDLSGTKVRPAGFLIKIARVARQLRVLFYKAKELEDEKVIAKLREAAPFLRIEDPNGDDNTNFQFDEDEYDDIYDDDYIDGDDYIDDDEDDDDLFFDDNDYDGGFGYDDYDMSDNSN